MDYFAFTTPLGYSAAIGHRGVVWNLAFGFPTETAARWKLDPELLRQSETRNAGWTKKLADRINAFLNGHKASFDDIAVELGPATEFQRSVYENCRRIPWGVTASYAELAERTGRPNAARAVGTCMAKNRIPLIIPCHRVVRADGIIGNFSAPGGCVTKQFLLNLEKR
jgi:methylated-DNA-[protein]-cysteine S-methyltransferase